MTLKKMQEHDTLTSLDISTLVLHKNWVNPGSISSLDSFIPSTNATSS